MVPLCPWGRVIDWEVPLATWLILICGLSEGKFPYLKELGIITNSSGFVLAHAEMFTVQRCTRGEHAPFHFTVIYDYLKSTTWKDLKVYIFLWEKMNTWLSCLEKIKVEKPYFNLQHRFNYFGAFSYAFALLGNPYLWLIWKTSGQAIRNDFEKQRIMKHLSYIYFDFSFLKFLSL